MSKIVLSGYYGYKNFGDEAILSVLVSHLSSLGAEIYVLTGDVEYTKNVYNNVNSVYRFSIGEVANVIKSSDVLISGGGSLLQDATSLKSIVYYLFIISLGILFNKKVVIFAQGIGPINNFFARFMTKLLLKQCYFVTVRDENSFNLLKSWDIPSEIVPDPVYSINIENIEKNGNVGIQLRDFKTMNSVLLQKLALFVNSKFSDRKIEIFSLQNEQDFPVCKSFERILHSVNPNIKTEIVTDNIVEKIKNLDYFIGMRFHSLLVALKSGAKTCAINYDIKVEQLAKDFNIPMISMNADENFEEIYSEIQNLNPHDIMQVVNSKKFDWSKFDSFTIN